METHLVARLAASPAGSLVGASGAARAISWFERPVKLDFPAIVLTMVAPGREWDHDGPDGVDRPRVQFDHFGLAAVPVLALRDAVRAEMEVTRSITVGAVQIKFWPAQLVSEQIAPVEMLADKSLFRVVSEYEFFWEVL